MATGLTACSAVLLSSSRKPLLNRLPLQYVASEHLMGLLTRFKELQERVETAYIKASQRDKALENASDIVDDSSNKHNNSNLSGVNSDPHTLITNQLDPVTCKSSEKEDTDSVVLQRPLENQADTVLENWIADVRKKTCSAGFTCYDAGMS